VSPRVRIVALLACLAAGALALLRSGPPAPAGLDAPAREFSASRARERLAALLADEAPHPVGSAAGAALRGRLVAQLRELGLAPEELPGFACSENGSCAEVVNVLVRISGQEPGPALLLATHHDSVPAGPGAADDGHGVAVVLELLRALQSDGPLRRPLLVVFTDGEEAGLLGARAFVEHPAFAEVGAVINLEARGTGGAARMFETSDGNAALLAAYAAGAPRPSAHSLSYEIYRRLPNDTDLSVFKRAGAQGLGFAFIGGVRRYHTPRDDLAHLDLGSVQQQGDSALGATRALLAAGIQPAAGNSTYADLFGLVLLRWPASLDLALAGLALLLTLLAAWRGAAVPGDRSAQSPAVSQDMSKQSPGAPSSPAAPASPADGRLRPRSLLAAAAATLLLGPLLGACGAVLALWLVGVASEPVEQWPASPAILLLTAAAAASAFAVFGLGRVAARVGPRAQAVGAWLVWSLLAVAVAVVMPGASILLIAPALLAGLALAAGRAGLATTLGGALAFALWVPLIPALVDALGLNAWLAGALVGWTWGVAAPCLARTHAAPACSSTASPCSPPSPACSPPAPRASTSTPPASSTSSTSRTSTPARPASCSTPPTAYHPSCPRGQPGRTPRYRCRGPSAPCPSPRRRPSPSSPAVAAPSSRAPAASSAASCGGSRARCGLAPARAPCTSSSPRARSPRCRSVVARST
jgi:hypothetical protein